MIAESPSWQPDSHSPPEFRRKYAIARRDVGELRRKGYSFSDIATAARPDYNVHVALTKRREAELQAERRSKQEVELQARRSGADVPGSSDIVVTSKEHATTVKLSPSNMMTPKELQELLALNLHRMVDPLHQAQELLGGIRKRREALLEERRGIVRKVARGLRRLGIGGGKLSTSGGNIQLELPHLAKELDASRQKLRENAAEVIECRSKMKVRVDQKDIHRLSQLARLGEDVGSGRVKVFLLNKSHDGSLRYVRGTTTEDALRYQYHVAKSYGIIVPGKVGLDAGARQRAAELGDDPQNKVGPGLTSSLELLPARRGEELSKDLGELLEREIRHTTGLLNGLKDTFDRRYEGLRKAAKDAERWRQKVKDGTESVDKLEKERAILLNGHRDEEQALSNALREQESLERRLEELQEIQRREVTQHGPQRAGIAAGVSGSWIDPQKRDRAIRLLQKGAHWQRLLQPGEKAGVGLQYRLEAGDYVLRASGRFSGKPLSEIPIDYLMWIHNGAKLKPKDHSVRHQDVDPVSGLAYVRPLTTPDFSRVPFSPMTVQKVREYLRSHEAADRLREHYGHTVDPDYDEIKTSLGQSSELEERSRRVNAGKSRTQRQTSADATRPREEARRIADEVYHRAFEKDIERRMRVIKDDALKEVIAQASREANKFAEERASERFIVELLGRFEERERRADHEFKEAHGDMKSGAIPPTSVPGNPGSVRERAERKVVAEIIDRGDWKAPKKRAGDARNDAQLRRLQTAAGAARRHADRAYTNAAQKIISGSKLWARAPVGSRPSIELNVKEYDTEKQQHIRVIKQYVPDLTEYYERHKVNEEGLEPDKKAERRKSAQDHWRKDANWLLSSLDNKGSAASIARKAYQRRLARQAFYDVVRAGGTPDEAYKAEKRAYRDVSEQTWKVPEAFYDEMGQGDEFARTRKSRGLDLTDEHAEIEQDFLKNFYRRRPDESESQRRDRFLGMVANGKPEVEREKAWNQAQAAYDPDYRPSRPFRLLKYESSWERIFGKTLSNGQQIGGLLFEIENATGTDGRQKILDLLGELRKSYSLHRDMYGETGEHLFEFTLGDEQTLLFNTADAEAFNFIPSIGISEEEQEQHKLFGEVLGYVYNRAVMRYNSPEAVLSGKSLSYGNNIDYEGSTEGVLMEKKGRDFSEARANRTLPESLSYDEEDWEKLSQPSIPFPDVELPEDINKPSPEAAEEEDESIKAMIEAERAKQSGKDKYPENELEYTGPGREIATRSRQ